MGNIINKIPVAVSERSQQNLSHPLVMSSDFGRMDVVYCNSDVVPGDTINLQIDGFLRGAPMPAPTYGSIDVNVRVFFVPHRILTSRENDIVSGGFSWDNFITGVSSNSHPYTILKNLVYRVVSHTSDAELPDFVGSDYERDLRRLYSQLRLPDYVYNPADRIRTLQDRINLWRFGAYQRVWWDWYRDSALIDESELRNYLPLLDAGAVSKSVCEKLFYPRYCCWKKDYFTTAKLNPQSGASSAAARNVASTVPIAEYDPYNVVNPNTGSIVSPPSGNTTIPIQWLRAANALQKYLERNNLAGSRLMERFLARFGNAPSPIALDMSEYLGGASRTIKIGDITSNVDNVQTDAEYSNAFLTPAGFGNDAIGSAMGQLAGKSASDVSSGSISYHAKEFGTIIAIQTIVPKIMYYQGLSRELTRGTQNDKFEYFTPEMENLGYQPLYKRELCYAPTNEAVDSEIFGFVPRYSDYKVSQGVVAGDLVLSGTSAGMNSWYLSRDFVATAAGRPSLDASFTTISPYPRLQLDRIFSISGGVGQYDHFNGFYHIEAHFNRPMSASSLPSLDEDLGQHGKTVEVQNGGVRM